MERTYQKIDRRKTRTINVGDLKIGGKNPILVQTMTNTPTIDIKSTLAQIKRVTDIGADIVRVSVPDSNSSEALKIICKESNGNHVLISVEVPIDDFGSISPLLFFFHPSNKPVIATTKKNENNNAPIVLWTFLTMRKVLA